LTCENFTVTQGEFDPNGQVLNCIDFVAGTNANFPVATNAFNDSTINASGNFDIDGTNGDSLEINALTPWALNVDGTSDVNWTNVQYSNASGSANAINAMGHGFDGGHNTNWMFPDVDMEGGVVVSGIADNDLIGASEIYNETMSGGVIAGGSAEEAFNDIIEVSGGAIVGGSADIATSARYWLGNTTSWNSTGNWSETSGGTSGASVPTSANRVIFDGGGTGNCVLDSNAACSSMTFEVTYSGNFDASTSRTITTGDVTISSSGTFDLGLTTTWNLTGNFDALAFSGTWTYGTSTLVMNGDTKVINQNAVSYKLYNFW